MTPRHAGDPSLLERPRDAGPYLASPFYDFVVYTKKKRLEKLHYMHQNPVKRGLVLEPEQWDWSSSRHYTCDERGPVLVNEPLRAEMKIHAIPQNDSSAG